MSPYVFTDDEQELRRRAWRFLMPAHERAWFERRLGELVAARILPMSFGRNDRPSYFRALMRDGGASPASRYRRLSEDAAADAKLIDPFAIIAARVVQADAVRLKALGWVQDLTTEEARNAAMRVAENRCLIALDKGRSDAARKPMPMRSSISSSRRRRARASRSSGRLQSSRRIAARSTRCPAARGRSRPAGCRRRLPRRRSPRAPCRRRSSRRTD
ncbi:MAG: hypothetical protein ACJ8C3_26320 [Microvirga sp.]